MNSFCSTCYFKNKGSNKSLSLCDLPAQVQRKDTPCRYYNFKLFPRRLLCPWKLDFPLCLHILVFTNLCHFPASPLRTCSDFHSSWPSHLHLRSLASSDLIRNHLMGLSSFHYKTFPGWGIINRSLGAADYDKEGSFIRSGKSPVRKRELMYLSRLWRRG